MVSTISRSIWTALINLRQCRNIKALDSTMFLGLKVVLTLIYKGFRGPVLSFDAPFWKLQGISFPMNTKLSLFSSKIAEKLEFKDTYSLRKEKNDKI